MKKLILMIGLVFFFNVVKSQNIIINNTDYNVDNVVITGCKLLDIYSIVISINYIPCSVKKIYENTQVKAFTTKKGKIYNIYLPRYYKNYELVLAHELIHINQMFEERLILINENTLIFEGKKYNINKYKDNPHEKEAYSLQSKLLNNVRKDIIMFS